MKSILDQEMPVNRRSRRLLFFWWTTVSVVVLLSIGLFLMRQSGMKPGILPIEQPSSPPKDDKQNPSSTGTNVIASTDPAHTPSITSPAGELPLNHHSKSSSQTSNIQHSKDVSDESPAEKENEILTENEIAIAAARGANDPINEIPSSTILPVGESIEAEPVKYDLRNESIASSIPSIRITNIPIKESPYSTVHSIEPSKAKRGVPLFEPDLAISGLIGQNGGAGAYGGAGLSVNLDRKLSITTGLGYSVFHPDVTLFGSTRADYSAAAENNAILIHDSFYSGISTYIEASNVNAEAGYNELEPLVESVTQWQVGAGVKWKFSRRFFTEAGMLIGFNTKATSEYPIVEGDPLTGIVQGRIGNSFNSYDVIRSTMTSLYAGAGYRFGQHLDVFVQWKHGLDTYLLNDNESSLSTDQNSGERSDYIRGLNLGLRYTL